ncbi:MAG TPA: GntR family transcriptional regulator [Porticoccaceae bacterium]|nr:GntR family transcriptional regulator [Porticoccaceae bacterium]
MPRAFTQQSPALVLADRIAADLKAGGHAPGEVVASLPALYARHDVGRPVLRQALRILEERGVAALRRGAGGGLVALPRSPAYAGRALSIVIESGLRNLSDMGLLTEAIDQYVYLHHGPRLSPADCEQLRGLVRRLNRLSDDEFVKVKAHHQLAVAIRGAVDDPAIELLEKAAYECALDLIPYSVALGNDRRDSTAWQVTLDTVEALVAGDTARLIDCQRRQRAVIEASWGADGEPALADQGLGDGRDYLNARSQAERIVRELLRDIRRLGWVAGERISSSVDLVRRFRTTADAVRQAVIILQQYGVITVEKGRAGGLYVAALDRAGMLDAVRGYLRAAGTSAGTLGELLLHLGLTAMADAERRAPGSLARAAALQTGPAPGAAGGTAALLAQLCGNPVFATLVELMAPWLAAIGGHHYDRALLAALAEGDLALARRWWMDACRAAQG